jgi:hypothetical protein
MLEKITERLPRYHDHLLYFRERCPDIMKERLGQALAVVYKDILQFCQEACKMFMKKSGGKQYFLHRFLDANNSYRRAAQI